MNRGESAARSARVEVPGLWLSEEDLDQGSIKEVIMGKYGFSMF
jgi:hypothetical protein